MIRSTAHNPGLSRGLLRRRHVLPGFGLSLGFTGFYLGLLVLIPLAGLLWKSSGQGWGEFVDTATSGRALAAYRLSLMASFAAAVINGVFGTIVAWVLVRYQFPGRRLMDALVDFPLALPTAVAGLTYTSLYAANGWVGQYADVLGVKVAYTRLGIIVVLTFVALPFVVRTVQPVLQSLERDIEEAAATLGANRLQTLRRVILPALVPAILTGVALAFARALGEYGSVIFIAGNLPNKTEIAPLLIVIQLEEFDYAGAAAIATVMLAGSFLAVGAINIISRLGRHG